jgi:hypothetical protein
MSKKRKPSDLFSPLASEDRLHPSFNHVRVENAAEPARIMMNHVYRDLPDPDGNFAQQFQTSGFDARTFELYLYAYLTSARYAVRREKPYPDFIVSRSGVECAIEATTANAPSTPLPGAARPDKGRISAKQLRQKVDHELPIRFGSPLKSKLDKRYDGKPYWELEHCKDMPFVVAIEAFHETESLFFTSSALGNYLYGRKSPPRWTKSERLFLTAVKLYEHRHRGKVIPSHFFGQPDTQHVSAVLFTNSGTWAKFNRMGYQAGYHRGNIMMFRRGTCLSSDPNSVIPSEFGYDMDFPPCVETWAQGLVVFHNPNAVKPLPPHYFRGAVTHYFKEGRLIIDVPSTKLLPFASLTVIVGVEDPDLEPNAHVRKGIRSIRLDEFEALGPPRPCRTLTVSQEKEWFASDNLKVVGTVVQDLVDSDWFYVLFIRKSGGGLKTEDMEINIDKREVARHLLLDAIERRIRKFGTRRTRKRRRTRSASPD